MPFRQNSRQQRPATGGTAIALETDSKGESMADSAVTDRPKKADFAKSEARAREVLESMGIDRPPVDPVMIARDMGVHVVFAEFTGRSRAISGFYDAEEDRIYVNREEHPKRQTFTVAHELGHRLLHREWAASNDYKLLLRDTAEPPDCYEQEANAFAAHLLVPRDMLAQYHLAAGVPELADLFLVSAQVIKNRLDSESRVRRG
jgi:Zn-dependent peptidase ImmA (M78 family)